MSVKSVFGLTDHPEVRNLREIVLQGDKQEFARFTINEKTQLSVGFRVISIEVKDGRTVITVDRGHMDDLSWEILVATLKGAIKEPDFSSKR